MGGLCKKCARLCIIIAHRPFQATHEVVPRQVEKRDGARDRQPTAETFWASWECWGAAR